jgi:hypothetical protein
VFRVYGLEFRVQDTSRGVIGHYVPSHEQVESNVMGPPSQDCRLGGEERHHLVQGLGFRV